MFAELRGQIQTLLKTIDDNVFFMVAKDDATFPYIVFDLPNSIDSGHLENFVFDIDVWDDDTNTTALEALCSSIDSAIHQHKIVVNNAFGVVFYRDSRLTLTDEDPRIRRRKYIYQARVYQNYN